MKEKQFYTPLRSKIAAWLVAAVLIVIDVVMLGDYFSSMSLKSREKARAREIISVLPSRQEVTDFFGPYIRRQEARQREDWKNLGAGIYVSVWEIGRPDLFTGLDRFFYDVAYGDIGRKAFVIQIWARGPEI